MRSRQFVPARCCLRWRAPKNMCMQAQSSTRCKRRATQILYIIMLIVHFFKAQYLPLNHTHMHNTHWHFSGRAQILCIPQSHNTLCAHEHSLTVFYLIWRNIATWAFSFGLSALREYPTQAGVQVSCSECTRKKDRRDRKTTWNAEWQNLSAGIRPLWLSHSCADPLPCGIVKPNKTDPLSFVLCARLYLIACSRTSITRLLMEA